MRRFALSLAFFAALAAPARSGVNQWTYIGPPDGLGARGPIVADPNAPGTIYVGYVGVRKTTDGGATWKPSGLPSSYVGTLLIDLSRPSTLYALANSSGQFGMFRTQDGGANWFSLNTSPLDSSVSALAMDPTSPLTLFASTSSGIYRTTDGGDTWARQGPNPQGEAPPTHIVIDPKDSLTIYATTTVRGDNYVLALGALHRSHDAGRSWSQLGVFGEISSLAIDPFNTQVLFIGSNTRNTTGYASGGVAKSSDGGLNWSGLSLFAEFVVGIAIAPSSPEAIYVTASGNSGVGIGVHRSTDGGSTWVATDGGLTDRQVGPLTVDPSTPNRVFVGNSQGVFEATFQPADAACSPGPATLCLGDGRFRVDVQWHNVDGYSITNGSGRAAPITINTGAFWFFDPTNLELVVKILDGRSINGKFWVFYGSLTNVEFTLAVTDTETGATKTYFNSPGQLASVADTSAF